MKKRKIMWQKALSACLATVTTIGILPMNTLQVQAFTGFQSLVSGTYEGSKNGYGGPLAVKVTIDKDGNVSAIQVKEHKETEAYYKAGIRIIDQIMEQQSVEVDAISGATTTSNAIKGAVKNALNKAVSGFVGGTGTKEDPYQICSEAGLKYLQQQVAEGTDYAGKYITLSSDITLSGEWTPIGSAQKPFAGIVDGNHHTINGLKITGDTQYAGLFGYIVSGAGISDIVLQDVEIATTLTTTTAAYAGAVVACMKNDASGMSYSVVDHCEVSGTIAVSTAGSAMVGGVIGMSNQNAAITNNQSSASVFVDCKDKIGNAGGLVGMMSIKALLMNNSVSGGVTLSTSNVNANIGGLAGSLNGIAYNNVANNIVTGANGNERVGGIAGSQSAASYVAGAYYLNENAFGIEAGKTDTDTVVQKTEAKMEETEFVEELHNNLKPSSLEAVASAVRTAGIAGCTEFSVLTERVLNQFYDWTLNTHKQPVPDNEIWTSTEYNDSIFASGTGTKENPYILETEAQVRAFASSLSRVIDYNGKYIRLKNNIVISADTDWIPVGKGDYAFQGDFDGNGCSVTGVSIGTVANPYQDKGQTYYGFFGVLGRYATVHQLTLDTSVYVQSEDSIYVGGLAGYIERSYINEVTVNGTVWGKSGMEKTSVNHFSGGLGGMALRATITNCISNADVYGEATGGIGEAGGILGLNNRTLTANCISTGTIRGTADRKLEGMAAIGGIAGVHAGTMVNCIATGDTISESYSQYVGALSGWTTGIGELYHNFYNKESNQTIESVKVNPVVSIGWLVGPGVNDEGEAYTGGVEFESIGLSEKEITSDELVNTMNAAFSAFPVDISLYTNVTLYQWEKENGQVLPVGAATTVTYEKPELPVVEKPVKDYTGTYYGRSYDRKLIVQIEVEKGNIKEAKAVTNTTGEDLTALLALVVQDNGTNNLSSDERISATVKAAVDTALARMDKNDTTAYGKVDPAIFAGGQGTKQAPYLIKTANQLTAFAAAINEDESFDGIYVALDSDIQLAGQWKPAGTDAHYPFKGVFDGKGHTISGLTIGTEKTPADIQYAGLFAYIEGGTVINLNIKNPSIYIQKTGSERIYAGALTSFIDQKSSTGYIDQCQVIGGTIVGRSASGSLYAGGLLGSAQYGTVTNCTIDATVDAKSTGAWTYSGVMAGLFSRMGVVNNKVTGNVTADASLNKAAVGGLAGFHSGASYNNVASVTLTAKETTGDVGALAGRNTGIGMMLTGYFDVEKVQKKGNVMLQPAGVGTIVSGEQYGKGYVERLTGLTLAQLGSQETITALNKNRSASEEVEKIKTLLTESWEVTLPESIAFLEWTKESGMPVLNYQTEEQKPSTDQPSTEKPSEDKPVINQPSTDQPSTETPSTDAQKPSTETQKPVTTQRVVMKEAKSTGYQSAAISWKKVNNASGYEVYRATGKNAAYKKVKTISSAKTVSYTDTKLIAGKTYYYKVRAVYKTGNKTTFGSLSKALSVKPVPATAKVFVKNKSGKKAVVSWKKVAGANGYVIYRADSKNGKYKEVKTVKSGKTVSFTNTKLKAKKTYYYKVRAYSTVSGKKVYGKYSTVQKVKIVR